MIEIREPTKEEDPQLLDIFLDSFYKNEHPLIDALFPNSDTPKGRETARARWVEGDEEESNSTRLLMRDTETGDIVGQGNWEIIQPDPENDFPAPVMEGDFWDSDDHREYANWLNGTYTEWRRAKYRDAKNTGKPVFTIDTLTVLKQFEGKGAGGLFMKWGLEKADEQGALCIVESSTRAASFYAKWGYETVETVKYPPPAKWEKYGTQECVHMVRQPKKPE